MSKVIEIKNRIKELILAGTIKTEGIKILKREFGETTKELSDLWIIVKQECGFKTTPIIKKKRVKKIEKQTIKIDDNKLTAEVKQGAIKQSLGQAKGVQKDKCINTNLKVLKKVATVKGKYDTYEKEGTKVKGSNLEFTTAEDIEKYEKKLIAEEEDIFFRKKAEIHSRLNEYLDVMLMEV